MGLHGDLSSIPLGDLLQNLEQNRVSGTLTICDPQGERHIRLESGRIALYASPTRKPLMDRLILRELVSRKQLDSARAKRKGSRRGLGETLVLMGVLDLDELRSAGTTMLTEDVCDLLSHSSPGTFTLEEGPVPPRIFDTEEKRLGLAIAIGPLLLEAARRSDHWELIRQVIPSDSVHFFAPKGVEPPEDHESPELAREIIRRCDGTRDVRELVAAFHDRRFAAYCVLADLVRARLLRAAAGDELVEIAREIAQDDPRRAREILSRGLAAEPHHVAMLELEAQLAEAARELDDAATARKTLAHLLLEAGRRDEGVAALEEARRLAPKDPAILERCLAIHLDERALEPALARGMELVEHYRAPGLHNRARAVLVRLVELDPASPHLARELARTHVDCGEVPDAVRCLVRGARAQIQKGRYGDARELYSEILELDPENAEAAQRIEEIDTQAFARRLARRRRWLRRIAATVVLAGGLYLVGREARARIAYADANHDISSRRLIEEHRYQDAIRCLERVRREHPFTPTTMFDVGRRLRDLKGKSHTAPPPPRD